MLQFDGFASAVDVAFWHRLGHNKLEQYKLCEHDVPIDAWYTTARAGNHGGARMPSYVSLDAESFVRGDNARRCMVGSVRAPGVLMNLNKLDAFKRTDKAALIKRHGAELWRDIVSGVAVHEPEKLVRFLLLSHADLKKHRYYHWFAFPAVVPAPVELLPWSAETGANNNSINISPLVPLSDVVKDDEQLRALVESIRTLNQPFFVIRRSEGAESGSLEAHTLSSVDDDKGALRELCDGSAWLAFVDPSAQPAYAGWPLRNLLALAAVRWKLRNVNVLCFRDMHTRLEELSRNGSSSNSAHSRVLRVRLASVSADDSYKTVGWERNVRGKLGPRLVDLRSMMDPKRLASTSVDLNLRLMRWRILPDLDLPKIAGTRCLLLGAGTLGCNVARCLLGWGVRHITLLDNGRVSYSNPVRQSLYHFQDCAKGGQFKAVAAAAEIGRVFPGAQARGVVLSIPMPGHAVNVDDARALDDVRRHFEELNALVQQHDVVFLLTDSRESRWLPSVMAAVYDKIVLNVALGFDTFVVLRHGRRVVDGGGSDSSHPDQEVRDALHESKSTDDTASESVDTCARTRRTELGCYFCNDVVAPTDSLTDRTLDQQCTVTRPGLAPMASAMSVELMISLLHHPERHGAPADIPSTPSSSSSSSLPSTPSTPLGFVPHQLRGFLAQFNILPIVGQRFDMCPACSDVIILEFRRRRFDMVLDALNTRSYLEDLSGLTAMKQATEDMDNWDDDDMEEEFA